MKKLLTISAITLSLIAPAKAQTVLSEGRKHKLTAKEITLLRKYKIPAMQSALNSKKTIQFNWVADLIFGLLDAQRKIELAGKLAGK